MERDAKIHGKKTKSIQFSPETTWDETIERILRPQKPSPSPTPKTFVTSTPGTFPRGSRFVKGYILPHQLRNMKLSQDETTMPPPIYAFTTPYSSTPAPLTILTLLRLLRQPPLCHLPPAAYHPYVHILDP
ncbi:hypothetical protein O181_005474 [Austropuccinia psidii MF-1]|uniref:Uncharacterized protein n=1 Tax=Austropuccinia psidii MF-1 TaxID=1389203 RepID=A0A9Q3GFX2_9BASI|nr:hypothetical protein [Austropuccinia psidii MF-1]